MLHWLDVFLFYAKTEGDLLDNIDAFLYAYSEIDLKVHAEKSNLFAKEIQF